MWWTKMWKSGTRWQRLSKAPLISLLILCFFGAAFLSGCSLQGGMIQARVLEEQEEAEGEQESPAGLLSVTYLDVGQGNGILVQCDDQTMLIDGGPRESSSFVVSYLNRMGIQKLDYMLISHFDEDHLAGAVGALHNFPVGTLLTPDYETDTGIYDSYTEAAEENGCEAVHPSLGDTFSLGSGSFQIISPVSRGHEDENQDKKRQGPFLYRGRHWSGRRAGNPGIRVGHTGRCDADEPSWIPCEPGIFPGGCPFLGSDQLRRKQQLRPSPAGYSGTASGISGAFVPHRQTGNHYCSKPRAGNHF